jgi:hypothetical protein
LNNAREIRLWKYFNEISKYIRTSRKNIFNSDLNQHLSKINEYREKFKNEKYPKFDVIGITTLFTFYWKQTIDTINFAKKLCDNPKNIFIGGIAATIVSKNKLYQDKDVVFIEGLLDRDNSKKIDKDFGDTPIDEYPLDYSILEEIDYQYPAINAYFGYMTRGCVNKCPFCAVPELEPNYEPYISLQEQINEAEKKFGRKKDLLLLDNNVFASNRFNEIKKCGFVKGATYEPDNEYKIALSNIEREWNVRAYKKKLIKIDDISSRLSGEEKASFDTEREQKNLLYAGVAHQTILKILIR